MPARKKTDTTGKKKLPAEPKATRNLFVIMPFSQALDRQQGDLDAFFQDNIKSVIENDPGLKFKYEVSRSGTEINITDTIIQNIYDADVVLCDLSGIQPNPNVMYELGLRLSLGNKPVILIREQHSQNQKIFDIQGLYTHLFSSRQYGALQTHLLSELKKLESATESFQSPVLKALGKDAQVINVIMKRQMKSLICGLRQGMFALQELLRRRVCSLLPPEAKQSTEPSLNPQRPWDIVKWFGSPQPPNLFLGIDFSPPVIPGMLGVLSFYHFLDIIPRALSEALYDKLHFLYYHYWAGAALLTNPTQAEYYEFIIQVANTNDAALKIEEYLSTENEEEKRKSSDEAIFLLTRR